MKTKAKTKSTPSLKAFSFWKENKTSGFFTLTEKELIEEFKKWLETRDRAWVEYYPINECLNMFIMEALTAIGNTDDDFEEYKVMEVILKPVRREYLDKQTA